MTPPGTGAWAARAHAAGPSRWLGLAEYGLWRCLGRVPELAHVATRVETVSPAERVVRPAALLLPGMLDRVVGTDPATSVAQQVAVVRGGPWTHRATRAFHLEDAELTERAVYCGGHRLPLRDGAYLDDLRHALPRAADAVDRAALAASYVGLRWFGDWLFDNVGRALLAERRGLPALSPPVASAYGHAERYGRMLSPAWTWTGRAHVRHLVVFDDVGQNADRRARYAEMRRRALAATPGRASGHGVFVLRGSHGVDRRLANEEELAEWAVRRGLQLLDPMNATVDEVLAVLRDARFVVGVDGSHLTHALLVMEPSGSLVTVMSPYRFVASIKDYTDAIGLGYATMVGTPRPDGAFHADVAELERTFDLAVARRG